MLTHLSIRNIVLIEQCDIEFKQGLCVLTGETGAGKSILLDALGLALGERSDARLLRQGKDQGVVTAEFDISANPAAAEILQDLGIEADGQLVIRRTLTQDGKSRCLANDETITQASLKRLGATLVEIHGQHDQQGLLDASTHREALDAFGRLSKEATAVAEQFAMLAATRQALQALEEEIAQAAREQEYLRHMRGELTALDPKPGEEETLAERRSIMMQSEKIFDLLQEVHNELGTGKGVGAMLRSAQRLISRSTLAMSSGFAPLADQLDRAAAETDEALSQLEGIRQQASYDPVELEQLEERLFSLRAAARKYNLPVDELAALRAQVDAKINILEGNDSRRSELTGQLKQHREHYLAAAQTLTKARQKAAGALQKAVMAELAPLKMESTHFHIRMEELPEAQWAAHGMDAVAFEVATNVTGKTARQFSPLGKIASGGELSRFMLAMKVSLSGVRSTPTLIFDEIDTGTGGAVADAIGRRLAALSQKVQVLVVTHLPQVAARGNTHLLVAKEAKGKEIVTSVEALGLKSRCEEVARMLAGATITPEARKAAQKLLDEAA